MIDYVLCAFVASGFCEKPLFHQLQPKPVRDCYIQGKVHRPCPPNWDFIQGRYLEPYEMEEEDDTRGTVTRD